MCDYSDAYILFNGTIAVTSMAAVARIIEKKVIFRNCTPFTDCLSKINNTQLGNDKYIDVVMSMYDLMEYNKKI